MNFSDEILMAYVDGELDITTRESVEAAAAEDPQLAEKIARYRALRSNVAHAFEGVLDEPIPERLVATAMDAPAGTSAPVTDLASVRTAKREHRQASWSWTQWTSIAASLLLGVLLGRSMLGSSNENVLVDTRGKVLPDSVLALALTDQLSSETGAGSQIDIALSIRDKSGRVCRAFTVRQPNAMAGLACREDAAWQIRALAQRLTSTDDKQYRMAGSALPPMIVEALETTTNGDPLDSDQEAAARNRGWE